MKTLKTTLIILLLCAYGTTFAQLTPYEDFTTSDEVSVVNTIKVDANMMPYYLERLKKTWVPAAEFQKEKGYIVNWAIYVSDLPNSGDFNLITAIQFANDEAARGSAEIFKEVTDHLNSLSNEDERDKIVTQEYPGMREITGSYRLRTVTFK
jgi:hypothetical protein